MCVVCGNYFKVLYCQQRVKSAVENSEKQRKRVVFCFEVFLVCFFVLLNPFLLIVAS